MGVEPEAGGSAGRVVAAGTLEHATPVVHDVGRNVNAGVSPVHERAIHPDLASSRKSHR